MSRDLYRIGCIGAGFIAQTAHMYAFSRMPNVRLAAIAEPHNELRTAVTEVFRFEESFGNYKELLGSADLDAVIVSLPRRSQSFVVKDALLADVGVVLSEKPIAMTLQEAKELVGLAQNRKTSWFVSYMKRFDIGVEDFLLTFQKLRTRGDWGALLHVSVRDFCGEYGVVAPPHIRRSSARLPRLPEGPAFPEGLLPDAHDDYDYTVNVAVHSINLLRCILDVPLKPLSFSVWSKRMQAATLDAQGCAVTLAIGPARLGRWDQSVEATFERGRISLLLPSPLARQQSAAAILTSADGVTTNQVSPGRHAWSFERQAHAIISFLEGTGSGGIRASEAIADLEVVNALWNIVDFRH